MTKTEASEFYNIPLEVLDEYERWGLCGEVKKVMGAWQYDDRDIERLSMIMTLHDIGFSNREIEAYMRLMLEGDSTEQERLRMLGHRRSDTLDAIHLREKQLDRIDYLRFKMKQKG
ncbi:MerR family transcriptional regulator [Clostridium sp. D33t1_170424_F3]|uniref:MerR family transcriptional regulator n=1 Tax=Clostridium sp. D33t1_170424_F3 TaxID=2787099 RepID=UPI0018AAC895|nr:MerR family transcriptional regulator [Clostridium sp. D33t1_170424_F3]